MKVKNKVLVIGLDGADWRVLEQLIEKGWMPGFQSLLSQGVKAVLRSTIPTQSYTAWTSFMTGKNPGKHGIYDFLTIDRKTYKYIPNDFHSIKTEVFFNIISRKGGKVGLIGIPMTYPPPLVNGFLIAGMFTPNPEATYTYPSSLREEINKNVNGFPMNVIRWNLLENEEDRLFEEAIIYTKQRVKVAKYLMTTKSWDFFMFVFTSLDRLQHAFLHLFDQTHPLFNKQKYEKYKAKIEEYVTLLDMSITDLIKLAGKNAITFIISDHGFQWVTHYFDLNQFLEKEGLLKFYRPRIKNFITSVKQIYKEFQAYYYNTAIDDFVFCQKINPIKILFKISKNKKNINRINWNHTVAYCHTSQGISINLQGREKLGIVPEYKKVKLLEQIKVSLTKLSHPLTKKPIVKKFFLKEEIFKGDYLKDAPDLLFLPLIGVTKRGYMRNFQRLPWKTGEHDLEGIFLGIGENIRKNCQIKPLSIMDIAPTILYVMGYEIPVDMDGKVISDIFIEEWFKKYPPKFTEKIEKKPKNGVSLTEEEQNVIENELKSLGYL